MAIAEIFNEIKKKRFPPTLGSVSDKIMPKNCLRVNFLRLFYQQTYSIRIPGLYTSIFRIAGIFVRAKGIAKWKSSGSPKAPNDSCATFFSRGFLKKKKKKKNREEFTTPRSREKLIRGIVLLANRSYFRNIGEGATVV